MPTYRSILAGGLRAARRPYSEAVADSLEHGSAAASASWDKVEAILSRTLLLMQLEGAATVLGIARRNGMSEEPEVFAKSGRISDILAGDDNGSPFTSEPFIAAVEAMESRIPRLASRIGVLQHAAQRAAKRLRDVEQTDAIPRLAKQSRAIREAMRRAFWVSDTDKATTINLRSLIADVIRGDADVDAITLPEFIDRANLAGAANLTDARLEVVYRNNLATAYTDGRAKALQVESVKKAIPLVRIDEINDRRTRGAPGTGNPGFHWQMDGYTNTIDEIDRQGLRPPNGHQCRASLVPVPRGEATRLGLVDEGGQPLADAIRSYNGQRQDIIDRGDYPDRGFQ